MKSTNNVWNNEKALEKFALQFQLASEDVETVKQLEAEQKSKLQNYGGRWFFKPLKLLS
jgi:hypothetical protein